MFVFYGNHWFPRFSLEFSNCSEEVVDVRIYGLALVVRFFIQMYVAFVLCPQFSLLYWLIYKEFFSLRYWDYVYTGAMRTRGRYRHSGSLYTWALCTLGPSVYWGQMYTGALCTLGLRVHWGFVYTGALCTLGLCIHCGSVYTGTF